MLMLRTGAFTPTTMKLENQKNAKAGIISGIVLQIAGRLLLNSGSDAPGMTLTLFGAGFFIWGCMNFAEGKGYSKWFGALGLLSCLGLGILLIIKDKHPQQQD